MSTYPWKEPLAKHFSQDIPLQRRFDGKDTKIFRTVQIKEINWQSFDRVFTLLV